MKIARPNGFTALFVLVLGVTTWAKPPGPGKDEKKAATTPPPAAATASNWTLLQWLLLQNAGPYAASVPFPELVRAAARKEVVQLDPGDASDAAAVAKIGATLDALLPRLNRPDSPLRTAAPLTGTEVTVRIAEDLRAALGIAPAPAGVSPFDPGLVIRDYPMICFVNGPAGKSYQLGVCLYPSGGRESGLRAFEYRAAMNVADGVDSGCYLLIALEYNGKAGRDLAFLNWELIDLARVSLRCSVGFEADENALHQPGAVITDGRKGRD